MSHIRAFPPQHMAALADGFTAEVTGMRGLRRLCDIAVELTDASSAGVVLAGPGRSLCEVVTTDERAHQVCRAQLASGRGPSIEAFRRQRVVVVPGPPSSAAPAWRLFAASCAEAGFSSAWSVPLAVGGQALGALELLCEQPGPASHQGVADTRTLAALAAALLVSCRRRERARQLVEELHRALTTRVVIEQAKGRLAERHELPAEAAFERLRRHARDRNLRLHSVAAAVARGELAL